MEQLSGALSGAAIGIYIFAVVWHGNTQKLIEYLKGEEGYVEFIVALLILGFVNKYGPTSKITKAITAFATIAVIVRLGEKAGINSKLADFASGRASGLDTIKSIFEGN